MKINENTTLSELIDMLKTTPEAVEAAKGEMLEKEVERLRGEVGSLKARISDLEEVYGSDKEIGRLLKSVKDTEKKIASYEKKLGGDKKLRRPGARMLRENGTLVAQSRDGSISVYTCGYALYKNISRQAVVWVPDALGMTRQSFTHLTLKEKKRTGMTDYEELDSGSLPWETALLLLGEAAAWRNAGGQSSEEDLEESANMSLHMSGYIEGPEEYVIRKEMFREAMDLLTPRQREVFIYYKVWGFNEKEVAGILGLSSVSTVCEHLKKVREALEKVSF